MDNKVVKVYKPTKVDLVGAAGHVEEAIEAIDVTLSGYDSGKGVFGDWHREVVANRGWCRKFARHWARLRG